MSPIDSDYIETCSCGKRVRVLLRDITTASNIHMCNSIVVSKLSVENYTIADKKVTLRNSVFFKKKDKFRSMGKHYK